MLKRIKDLKSSTIIDDKTYMLVDSASEGTRKYKVKDMEQDVIQKVNELFNSSGNNGSSNNTPTIPKDIIGIKNINSIKDVINNKIIVTITLTDGTSKSFDIYNGKDGVDGYTPIKGTDYYTPQEISEIITSIQNSVSNGQDSIGISNITTSKSNGVTTVTITLTDNTSKSFTVKDGVDGKDYVLTESDKAEIVNEVINSLPDASEVMY